MGGGVKKCRSVEFGVANKHTRWVCQEGLEKWVEVRLEKYEQRCFWFAISKSNRF